MFYFLFILVFFSFIWLFGYCSKDHESLVRSKEDLEKQLSEQKVAVDQQQQRFQETDSRHKNEIDQIRQAGHDALAIIVEEYKGQSRLAVQQEREKSERLLNEAITKETERCQALLQEQYDRLEECGSLCMKCT